MPRAFFRKFSVKRSELEQRWYLRPFRRLLGDPKLLSISRRCVVPAVAAGLFVSWFPVPGHVPIAMLIALTLRVNVIIAGLTTFIANPITMAPMYYTAYRVGRAILELPPQPFPSEISWQWLSNDFLIIGKPLLVGVLLFATASAAIGYVSLNLVWRGSVAASVRARRRRHARRARAAR